MDKLGLYIQNYNLPKPLPKKEIYELFKNVSQGDTKAREKIIYYNLKLVLSRVYGRFSNYNYEEDDLFEIGTIGLIKAVNTFDVFKNLEFSSYASRCIDNEILMFIRKKKKDQNIDSLDDVINYSNDGDELTLKDILCDKNDFIEKIDKEIVNELIRKKVEELPPRDKEIIMMYFGFYNDRKYTMEEIAQKFSISRSYVSHITTRSLKKIEYFLEKEGVIELRGNKINNDEIKQSKQEVTYKEENKMKKEQKLYTPEEFFGCFEGYTKEEVLKALDNLKENNKNIMELRYGLNGNKAMQINEIRQLYNLTSVQVNNVIINSKARIKEILEKNRNKSNEEKTDNDMAINLTKEFISCFPNKSNDEIVNAFLKLQKRQKEILILFYGLDGNASLSYKEIAEKLGIKQASISQQIYLAKKKMNQILSRTDEVKHNKEDKKEEFDNRIVENTEIKKDRISDDIKEEIQDQQILDDNKDKKIINQSDSDKETINVDNILVEDCINIISILRNPIYSKFVEKFNPKELVIVLLKLGYINDTYYSTKQIAAFLNVDEQTIEEITRNGLVLYKENISNYVDAAINKMIEEPIVFTKK